jgi:hypothetical protein
MDSYYLLKNWVLEVEAGRSFGNQASIDSYIEVHYEYLVEQPKKVIVSICEFLNEEFHPNMLDHTPLAWKLSGPGGHTEVREPISTTSVGRWITQMQSFDQKLANQIAGPTLLALGYEMIDLEPLTLRERLRAFYLAIKYQFYNSLRQVLYGIGVLDSSRRFRRR